MAHDFTGIFVPSTTPFDAEGELDLDAWRDNLRGWLRADIAGLVVGGSSGEAVLLDESERLRLIETARDVAGDRAVIAGTGAESTRATIRMSLAAAEAGADALLVQPPAFYRGAMTPAVLDGHYRALADASPIPVILYQVPLKFSTLDLDDDWVAEMSHHANVVGIKDSRGKLELIDELVSKCADDFRVLVGNGALLLEALRRGAAGAILGVANLMPAACVEIFEAHAAGDSARAEQIQSRVGPVHNVIVGQMGVPGVKAALDRLGMRGGSPRSPLMALDPSRHGELEQLLGEVGIGAD